VLGSMLLSPFIHSPNAMRLSPIILIGVLTVVAATAVAVPFAIHSQFSAQGPSATGSVDEPVEGNNPSSNKGGRRGGILHGLNLTPAQFKQLSAVRRQYQPSIRDRAKIVRTSQAELRRLLASSASEAEVKSKYQQVQQLRQELQQLRFESLLAMRHILTPQQRQAFEAELGRRKASRRDRL
jgi:periplasmic protein CpxP/Spy